MIMGDAQAERHRQRESTCSTLFEYQRRPVHMVLFANRPDLGVEMKEKGNV